MTADLRALRQSPFDLLLQFEAQLRSARLDISAGQQQFWVGLGFRIADDWFVAPKADVREVIPPLSMTRVPGARPWMMGVANLRGNLLPVCDLGRLLGHEHDRSGKATRLLVFNSDRVPVGFLVDEVAGYRQFTPAEQRHEMVSSAGDYKPYLLGAFVREGQPWLAMSLHKIATSDAYNHAGW